MNSVPDRLRFWLCLVATLGCLKCASVHAVTAVVYTNDFESYVKVATNSSDISDADPVGPEWTIVDDFAVSSASEAGVQVISWLANSTGQANKCLRLLPNTEADITLRNARSGSRYVLDFSTFAVREPTSSQNFYLILRGEGSDNNGDDILAYRVDRATNSTVLYYYDGVGPSTPAWIATPASQMVNVWQHHRMIIDPNALTFDLYVDNMTTPVVTGAELARPDAGVPTLIRIINEGNSADDGWFAIDGISLTVEGSIDLTNTFAEGFESYPAVSSTNVNANPLAPWITTETYAIGAGRSRSPSKVQVVGSNVVPAHSGGKCLKLEGGQRGGASVAWGLPPKSDVQITWWARVPAAPELKDGQSYNYLRMSLYGVEDGVTTAASSAGDCALLGYGVRSDEVGGATSLTYYVSNNWCDTTYHFTPDTWEEYRLTTLNSQGRYSIVKNPSSANPILIVDRAPMIGTATNWGPTLIAAWSSSNGTNHPPVYVDDIEIRAFDPSPAIVTQPQSRTNTVGSTASFFVVATGAGPLSFQWRLNGVGISAATTTNLTLTNVQPTNAGNYSVVVANAYGAVTSQVAVLTVVKALGAGPLYVDLRASNSSAGKLNWVNEGVLGDFAGKGTATLVANVAGTGVPGVLFVDANSAYVGPAAPADLTGNSDRSVEVWVLNPSLTAEESLVSWGRRGQIRRNNVLGYGDDLRWGAVAFFDDDIGWSSPAMVPAIRQWHHLVMTYDGAGKAVVYVDGAVSASKTLGGPLDTYPDDSINLGLQRSEDGVSLGGGLATCYLNSVRVHGGLLTAQQVATNYAMGPFVYAAGVAPSIVSSPQSQTVSDGQAVDFTVVAQGTAPLAYQWRKTGANLAGATSSIYTLNNVQTTDAGSYDVVVGNAAGSVTSTPPAVLTVTVAPRPDLVVSSATGPAEAWSDYPFDVSWVVANAGNASALGSWVDRVYLSRDQQSAGAILLGAFPYADGLAAGQSVSRVQSVSFGRSGITNGNYWLVVVTDADNSVAEKAGEGNNTRVSAQPISVRLTPLPDLVVESITAPTNVFSGQKITVQWTVRNRGPGAPDVISWSDQVYLSVDGTPSSDDSWLTLVPNTTYLGSNEAYVASAVVEVPFNAFGNYHILVRTDAAGGVREENETNNVTNRLLNVTLSPAPDLRVTSVSPPAEIFCPGTFTVSWTVTNVGSGPVLPFQSSWVDSVYLSTTHDLSGDHYLVGWFPNPKSLAPGEGYRQINRVVSWPESIGGQWLMSPSTIPPRVYAVVVTDEAERVWEHLYDNNNTFGNTNPIIVHVQPPPQMYACGPSASYSDTSPSSGGGGGGGDGGGGGGGGGSGATPPASNNSYYSQRWLHVNWTACNYGAGDTLTNFWNDEVYLSRDAVLDSSDYRVGSLAHNGALPAGSCYTTNQWFELPSSVAGRFRVIVRIGVGGTLDVSSYTASELEVDLPVLDRPDLQVAAVHPPASAIAGSTATVWYTLTNAGAANSLPQGWTDTIGWANPDGSTPVPLASASGERVIAPRGWLSVTNQVSIPESAAGDYRFYVSADTSQTVDEGLAETNNGAWATALVHVDSYPPDLRVTSLQAPTTAMSGSSLTVSWAVVNSGLSNFTARTWQDSVYLSRFPDSLNGAISLGSISRTGNLAVGASYTNRVTASLPYRLSGQFYVFVQVDSGNTVFEGAGETNNLVSSATLPGCVTVNVTQTPMPDLVVSTVSPPSSGYAGREVTVNWTVRNTGQAYTAQSNWVDYVYLSKDQVFDATDPQVAYVPHAGGLIVNASYTTNATLRVPATFVGPCYVFVVADKNDNVFELNEDNNRGASTTAAVYTLPPPADLVPTSITVPPTGIAGQPAAIRWTVKNQGVFPAEGSWQDTVYLSADGAWDINDPLLGRVTHEGPLAVGDSYTEFLSNALPGLTPGGYRVIVRTDIMNNVRESDESNNIGVSAGVLTSDVIELTLGQPYTNVLATDDNHFYKVQVPAGETLAINADSQTTNAWNELFTRFGAMPSRAEYDYLYEQPFLPDVGVTVPETTNGWYYNLFRSEYSQTTPQNYQIEADLVPFAISSVSPTEIGDTGQVTLTLKGARFDELTSVTLRGPGGATCTPHKLQVRNASQLRAVFLVTNLAHAGYTVCAAHPAHGTVSWSNSISVASARACKILLSAQGNAQPLAYTRFSFQGSVRNEGNVDIPFIAVVVNVKANVSLGLRRPAETWPYVPADKPVQWEYDMPTALHSDEVSEVGFIIKDQAPGESTAFIINFGGLADTVTPAVVGAEPYERSEFVALCQQAVERLRTVYLARATALNLTDPPRELTDGPLWWEKVYQEKQLSLLLGESATNLVARLPDESALAKTEADDSKAKSRIYDCSMFDCTKKYKDRKLFSGLGVAGWVFELNFFVKAVTTGFSVGELLNQAFDCGWRSLDPFFVPYRCKMQRCEKLGGTWFIYNGEDDTSRYTGELGAWHSVCVLPVRSRDPNALVGPDGFGPNRWTGNQDPMVYTVNFENVTNASAPAQSVRVVNPLPSTLDWRTFRLSEIALGTNIITVPANRSFYRACVNLGADQNNLLADVVAGIDIRTGQAFCTLSAIDPATGERPEDSQLGLLPPNTTNHIGEGHITYTIKPKAGQPAGTLITNQAAITFDSYETILTGIWTNTLDAFAPTSRVVALPTTMNQLSFDISWFGQDETNGAGVARYDVYFSDNGGEWTLWQSATATNSATFTGVPGHNYAFYSIARDNVGNVESKTAQAEAATTVASGLNQPPVFYALSDQAVTDGQEVVVPLVATDADTNQALTFSFASLAPAGAVISQAERMFRWTPTSAQAPSTNLISIKVVDSAIPAGSATQSFTVYLESVVRAPVVQAVPGNQRVMVGGQATFAASFLGLAPLSYQWRFGGTGLAGQTNAVLSLSNVQPAQAGEYRLTVANGYGSVTLSNILLTVEGSTNRPVIVASPANRSVVAGTNTTFTVVATGDGPLRYQWQWNGADLAGATNASLMLSNVAVLNSGAYRAAVSNSAGLVFSAPGLLTVLQPPLITIPPQSLTNVVGTTASFSVTAGGTPAPAYRWQHDGKTVADATNATYTIASVEAGDAGAYAVVVTNAAGSVVSAPATLTVWAPVVIKAQPQSRTNVVGTTATFTVTADGAPAPACQWRLNGTNLAGATASSCTIASVQAAHAGAYTVVLTNLVNSVTSSPALLTVWAPPSIEVQPQGRTVMEGDPATFSVTARGLPVPCYQWLKGGMSISGATASAYPIASVRTNDAGLYSVLVTNAAGVTPSSNALLAVQYYRDCTFANTNRIRIRDFTTAVPYPSVIPVAGVEGTLAKLTVKLSRLSHTWPGDIDALVVGPGGQASLLMSDAGAYTVLEETFIFDDDAADFLPESDYLASGTFKPTDYAGYDPTNDVFAAPAPAGPYLATFTNFIGGTVNGSWSLYVRDDAGKDLGEIANGWAVGFRMLGVATVSAASVPVRLEAPATAGGGRFQFFLRGENGRSYRIESSTNLQTWSECMTCTATNAAMPVSVSATNKTVFFRAIGL